MKFSKPCKTEGILDEFQSKKEIVQGTSSYSGLNRKMLFGLVEKNKEIKLGLTVQVVFFIRFLIRFVSVTDKNISNSHVVIQYNSSVTIHIINIRNLESWLR